MILTSVTCGRRVVQRKMVIFRRSEDAVAEDGLGARSDETVLAVMFLCLLDPPPAAASSSSSSPSLASSLKEEAGEVDDEEDLLSRGRRYQARHLPQDWLWWPFVHQSSFTFILSMFLCGPLGPGPAQYNPVGSSIFLPSFRRGGVSVLSVLLVLREMETEAELLNRGLWGPGCWVRGGCPWLQVGDVGW